MIERALGGEIERHFEPVLPASRHEATKIGERAELGMDRVMAAFRRADGVETAGVVGFGLERVIAPLAIGMTNRMDRGEIDDIEAEAGDVRQPCDAIIESAMPAGYAPLAARHHLVPGSGARPRSVGIKAKGPASPEIVLECSPCERQRFVGQKRLLIR